MDLIFSDVHGNLPALELLLKTEKNIDRYICLGDLVNYGPWSNECIDLMLSLPNKILIMGNHEEAFINKSYSGENRLVLQFFNHTIKHFSRFDSIQEFIPSFEFNNFTFIHTLQNKYIYPNSHIELDGNYVIGHSHIQFVKKQSNFTLYNPGSAGQNRTEINRIDYIVLDTEKMVFSLKHIYYQAQIIINEMISGKYPQDCIDYYNKKMKM